MKNTLCCFLVLFFMLSFSERLHAQITFTGEELLGKPTDNSITVNIVPASDIYELYYEYGTSPGVYTDQTGTSSATGGQPHEMVISGLAANTRYYYRLAYRTSSGGTLYTRDEHTFHTQRAPGSTFKFTIISDAHGASFSNAVVNINNDQPDFHFDLGDIFMTDGDGSQSAVNSEYLAFREPNCLDGIGHSAAIFLASGNHENEEGWNLDDTPFSIAVGSVKARKLYYPTPIPDGFYSGNTDPLADLDPATYGDQYREDYYAWEWGDVLFVVFDPFQYTMTNPYGSMAGEGTDDPASGDRWNWTLGEQQYDWLKQTLQNSAAKYKFMFAHHMLGGEQDYVREGATPAHMFEWGGYNADGTNWGWDSHRPGRVDDDPIRQLMIDYGVSAFFHGHDHQYAYQVRDGIVYQCLPTPNSTFMFSYYSESDPYTERVLSVHGSLCVTVTPTIATVELISSDNTTRTVLHTYDILPNTVTTTYELTMAVDPGGSGTTSPSAGTHTYAEDAVVNISASPNTGFEFDHWEGDVADPDEASTTVTMDGDKTVTAYFVSVPVTYDLTMAVDPVSAGTTSPAVGLHTYDENEIVPIIATAEEGYEFDHWSGSVADPDAASTTVEMNANKTVTAYFEIYVPEPTVAGDLNGDDLANSTDALIVLSCDVGIDVSQFCPVNCGDVNVDGVVNSTDALIILSYDAGLSVPYSVGETGCPSSVTPCPGCNP
jgi:hypothetical protein